MRSQKPRLISSFKYFIMPNKRRLLLFPKWRELNFALVVIGFLCLNQVSIAEKLSNFNQIERQSLADAGSGKFKS